MKHWKATEREKKCQVQTDKIGSFEIKPLQLIPWCCSIFNNENFFFSLVQLQQKK